VINLDDIELVAKVAKGDERAFLVLYDRYASRVHALTLRILGESMLAEEATQDTFLKLWSRAHQYLTERGSLLVWLLTIARRTALDRLRLEGRRLCCPIQKTPIQCGDPLPTKIRFLPKRAGEACISLFSPCPKNNTR